MVVGISGKHKSMSGSSSRPTKRIGIRIMIVSNDYDIKQLISFDLDNMWINFMSNEMFNKQKIFLAWLYGLLSNFSRQGTTKKMF